MILIYETEFEKNGGLGNPFEMAKKKFKNRFKNSLRTKEYFQNLRMIIFLSFKRKKKQLFFC
jgi:hypothetical protein